MAEKNVDSYATPCSSAVSESKKSKAAPSIQKKKAVKGTQVQRMCTMLNTLDEENLR